ncbi:MAG: hypothetical protein NTU51_10620 [Bacteroidetes bacterium]|nr:hypothetical protein [Bacteroidota bacterium]
MPSPEAHIKQVCGNLSFLGHINKCCCSWDWQVTVSFYAAVHLVNSHLAQFDLHYRTHADVTNAINPENTLSVSKLPQEVYLSYKKLQGLSRRSRYLVHDDPANPSSDCFLTYDKHFIKAVKKLDILLDYFITSQNFSVPIIEVKCIGLKLVDLKHLKVIL